MGGYISNLLNKIPYFKKEQKILLLGLDAAGKTTILYQIKEGELIQTPPTIGFNIETIKIKNLTIESWDLGGNCRLRKLEKYLCKDANAIIYVVDSNEENQYRIEQNQEELQKLLSYEILNKLPLLVLANKSDIAKKNLQQITEMLKLDSIIDRDWKIQSTNAIKCEGLYEGLDWLFKILQKQI